MNSETVSRKVDISINGTDNASGAFAKAGQSLQSFKRQTETSFQSMGRGGGKGMLEELNNTLGRKSEFTHVLHAMEGAGALLGARLALGIGNESLKAMVKMRDELAEGKKPAGEIFSEFAKGIPLVGQVVEMGASINELFTGDAAELRHINEESTRLKESWTAHRDLVRETSESYAKMEEIITHIQGRGKIADLEGPARDRERVNQQNRGELQDIGHTSKAEREKVLGKDDEKLIAARRAFDAIKIPGQTIFSPEEFSSRTEDQKMKLLKEGAFVANSSTSSEYLGEQQKINAAKAAKNSAKIALAGMETFSTQNSTERQKATTAAQETQAKEIAAQRRELKQRDDKEQVALEAESFARVNSIIRSYNDETLKAQGRFYEADLQQIRDHTKDRLAELDKAQEAEVQKRMHDLEETRDQALRKTEPRYNAERVAVRGDGAARETARAVKEEQDRGEAIFKAKEKIQELQDKTSVEGLRAKGRNKDADLLEAGLSHRQRLAGIDESYKEQIAKHRERQPELEQERQAAKGAEGASFDATLATMARNRSESSRPIEGFAGSESLFAGGVRDLGAYAFDKQGGAGDSGTGKPNQKMEDLLQQLLEAVKKSQIIQIAK